MRIHRREVLKSVGGTVLATALSPALYAVGRSTSQTVRRRMIVRADDIGMSKVCNIGTFEAIDHGIVTVAAVMLADPGTGDALEHLKSYPWLSIDWHMRMWGIPVSSPESVPSLTEKSGAFASRFRTDRAMAPHVDPDEA